MAYGKGYRRREGGPPRILWEEGGQALRYVGQRIPIVAFQATAQACLANARGRMDGLFWQQWAAVEGTVDLDRIVDTLLYEAPGASFATHPANRWLAPGHRRLADLARKALWEEDGGAGRWKPTAAAAYLRQVERAQKALLLVAHVWGGQPGRGPELLTMRYANT